MMRYVEQRIINASADQVFDVIADFPAYSEWNTWIHFAQKNQDQTVTVKTTIKGKEKVFQHKIIEMSRPHTFHWCDIGWFTHLAFGQRIRHIEPLSPNQCRYSCELRVTGIAAKLAELSHGSFMREGLAKEANNLTSYAESLAFK